MDSSPTIEIVIYDLQSDLSDDYFRADVDVCSRSADAHDIDMIVTV